MNIGIAGVGGIGSNVALNLVRSGVQSLKIVDFDRVDPSNLNRQFYFLDQVGFLKVDMLAVNLRRISPNLCLETHCTRLTADTISDIFRDCELVVEGFDRSPDKKMLLEQFGQQQKMVVSASGIAGADIAPITSRMLGNAAIVGDFSTDCSNGPLYAHKVIAVAARMTEIILSYRQKTNG